MTKVVKKNTVFPRPKYLFMRLVSKLRSSVQWSRAPVRDAVGLAPICRKVINPTPAKFSLHKLAADPSAYCGITVINCSEARGHSWAVCCTLGLQLTIFS